MFGARWRSDGSVEQGERLVLEGRMGIFLCCGCWWASIGFDSIYWLRGALDG